MTDFTCLRWIPAVTYTNCGASVSFEFELPMGRWRHKARASVGDWGESASGVPESRVYRHDRERVFLLRFFEDEWPTIEEWLRIVWSQAQAFTFQLDKAVPSTARSVYLISPQVGDDAEPDLADDGLKLELSVILRTADGSLIDLPYNPRA